jgi:hypothetical protein
MGAEDLFWRKKARKGAALERQRTERARSPRFLIICEGTKTEPNYLKELLSDLKIRSQTVTISPNDGSSPDRVLKHAIKMYDEDALNGDSFDKVFCVFDRDEHTTFNAAVQKIRELAESDPPRPFFAITSAPCFEYWLLLHFGYTDAPFHSAGKKSVCDNLVKVLRTKPGFKTYGKGQSGIYWLLKDQTGVAIAAAKKARATAAESGHTDPHTYIDELIECLQALASK